MASQGREISPELVLVDPELAAVARRELPQRRPPPAVPPAAPPAPRPRRRMWLAAAAGIAVAATIWQFARPSDVSEPPAVAPSPAATLPTSTAALAVQSSRSTFAQPAARPKHVRASGSVRTSPVLVWRAVARATYYDVIIWSEGRRVLDLWPQTSRVTIPTSWVRRGRRLRLVPGRYLWFAYPGFGTRAVRRYGQIAASGSFVVRTGS